VREYGVYLVTGKREYRGHAPGTTFEASLDPGVEHRAVTRGDITLLRRATPDLIPGSATFRGAWAGAGVTNTDRR
jgi:hypothetical protein